MITFVPQPTDLQCGQAVLAMITGYPTEEVVKELNNSRETNLRETKAFLRRHGLWISDQRIQVKDKSELPLFCILSLETPRCWHWSLYRAGVFYDPEHGILDDFPESNRKYFWEVIEPQTLM